jgi:hypothetical protein
VVGDVGGGNMCCVLFPRVGKVSTFWQIGRLYPWRPARRSLEGFLVKGYQLDLPLAPVFLRYVIIPPTYYIADRVGGYSTLSFSIYLSLFFYIHQSLRTLHAQFGYLIHNT